MATATIKDSHLTYNGTRYFRGRAEDVEIGSFGEKRQPALSMNYLEVKGRISPAKIQKAKTTIVDIDEHKLSKTDINVGIKAIVEGVPVNLSTDDTYRKLKNNEMKLLKISVANNDMERAVNDSPIHLKDLEDYGGNARVAHQIFVVIEATLAEKYANNTNVELSIGVGPVKISVGGGNTSPGGSTVTLEPGSTFAYLLLKIDWNDNKTRVIDMDDDQWSTS